MSRCCFLVMQLWLESAHAQHCAPNQNYATVHHHIKVMQAQIDDEPSKKQPTEDIEHSAMPRQTRVVVVGVVLLLAWFANVSAAADCATVIDLLSACSSFVLHGYPDPYPESPCCTAISSLSRLSDSFDSRFDVCRCLMSAIATYNPNATAIATLPGFCGVSLGFTIHPNTDCE